MRPRFHWTIDWRGRRGPDRVLDLSNSEGVRSDRRSWKAGDTGAVENSAQGGGPVQRCKRSSRVSAGVFQPRVLRGRLLRAAATAARSSAVCLLRSVPLGKYCLNKPLVFSFVPRATGSVGRRVDGQPSVDAKLCVLSHLCSLVPRQRPAEFRAGWIFAWTVTSRQAIGRWRSMVNREVRSTSDPTSYGCRI